MVSPIFKKNTLEQTSFELTDDGFLYRGISYNFDEIRDVKRYRQVLETKYVMVGSDHTHGISIMFEMNSGEKVQLTEQPTLLSSSKIEKVDEIEKIYAIVSEKTFQTRAQKYLDQVSKRGFFEYSGWHFYPDKRKIVDYENRRSYQINSIKMLKSYGYIKIENKVESIGEKISKKIKGSVGINTLNNTDVFFALLKHFFKLEWRN